MPVPGFTIKWRKRLKTHGYLARKKKERVAGKVGMSGVIKRRMAKGRKRLAVSRSKTA